MPEHGSFTKRRIDAMKSGDTLWDNDVTGLGIRCRAGGAKSFCLKYRIGGRQRWITIGGFGSPWTVVLARKRARKLLGEVVDGKDPAERIKADKRAGTVAELCVQYREAIPKMPTRRGRLKARNTLSVEAGNITRHIVPLLGQRRIPDVTRRDVEKFQEQVAAGVTKTDVRTGPRGRARVTGGQGTAARCLNTLGAIFAYAVKLGLRQDNPVHGVTRFKGKSAKKFLNPNEMKALGCALRELESEHPQSVTIIRLLAVTGARRNEIAHLQWSNVDLHHGVLHLPSSKTGERVIILSREARDLINTLSRHHGTDLVFPPTRAGAHYQSTPKVWRKVRARAKVSARIHDLRHHFASVGAELGYALPTISALLGHSLPGVTGVYVHAADAALKAAADRIAGVVWVRLEGQRSDVVDLAEQRGYAPAHH
jgi:integrase